MKKTRIIAAAIAVAIILTALCFMSYADEADQTDNYTKINNYWYGSTAAYDANSVTASYSLDGTIVKGAITKTASCWGSVGLTTLVPKLSSGDTFTAKLKTSSYGAQGAAESFSVSFGLEDVYCGKAAGGVYQLLSAVGSVGFNIQLTKSGDTWKVIVWKADGKTPSLLNSTNSTPIPHNSDGTIDLSVSFNDTTVSLTVNNVTNTFVYSNLSTMNSSAFYVTFGQTLASTRTTTLEVLKINNKDAAIWADGVTLPQIYTGPAAVKIQSEITGSGTATPFDAAIGTNWKFVENKASYNNNSALIAFPEHRTIDRTNGGLNISTRYGQQFMNWASMIVESSAEVNISDFTVKLTTERIGWNGTVGFILSNGSGGLIDPGQVLADGSKGLAVMFKNVDINDFKETGTKIYPIVNTGTLTSFTDIKLDKNTEITVSIKQENGEYVLRINENVIDADISNLASKVTDGKATLSLVVVSGAFHYSDMTVTEINGKSAADFS